MLRKKCLQSFIGAITQVIGRLAFLSLLMLSISSLAEDAQNPRTDKHYDDHNNDFTFAIIADLTGGRRDGVFETAIEGLNLLRPAFVMSVGDLIEGHADKDVINEQWNAFDKEVNSITAPFYYTVGNHDISSKHAQEVWETRNGRRYYHFRYKEVLFLVLDSMDFDFDNPNPGPSNLVTPEQLEKFEQLRGNKDHYDTLYSPAARTHLASMNWDGTQDSAISNEQVKYFQTVIADNTDVRWAFAFLHHPVWQGDGNPNFEKITAAFGERPFTVFAGHTHNYRYFEKGSQMHIRLSTTGGIWVNKAVGENFDHITLVSMRDKEPVISNLRLDGLLGKTGKLPDVGEPVCFSEKECLSAAGR